ncbi:alpha-ketoglutarate dehydrogenase component 4 isoform 3-T4 [Polymixia lowei]
MGGKVSSKMAAPTARVIQAVRPHAPLIKFPNRQGIPKPNAAPPSLSRPTGPLTLLPGAPDTLASVQLLPQRYRRRVMAVEEMDYIQVRDKLTRYILHSEAWWTRVMYSDSVNATNVLIHGNQFVSLLHFVPQYKRSCCHTTSDMQNKVL